MMNKPLQHIFTPIWSVPLAAWLLTACASNPSNYMSSPFAKVVQTVAASTCMDQRGSPDLLPPKSFTSDGCSLWPDADWAHCCLKHDIEYWCGGTYSQRAAADKRLQSCVASTGHPHIGKFMELGVRVGGMWVLPTPFRWGYGWPWLSPMTYPSNPQERSIQLKEGTDINSEQ